MDFNAMAAEDTLGYIKAHPEQHQQQTWRCATGMCFAGHVALRNGAHWATDVDRHAVYDEVITPDGRVLQVALYAVEVLTGREGPDDYPLVSGLFSGANTLEDLEVGVKALANGNRIDRKYIRGEERVRMVDTGRPL